MRLGLAVAIQIVMTFQSKNRPLITILWLVAVLFIIAGMPVFAQTTETGSINSDRIRSREFIIIPESDQTAAIAVSPFQVYANITLAGKHFRLEEKIGQGGKGAVYEAVDTQTNQTVGLKLTPLSVLAPTNFAEEELRKKITSRPSDFLRFAEQINDINQALIRTGLKSSGFYFLPQSTELIYLDGQYTGDNVLNGERIQYGAVVMPLAGKMLRTKSHELKDLVNQLEFEERVKMARSVQNSILAEISALAEIGYGHFDINPANISLDTKSGNFSLIDWEATRKLTDKRYNALAFHELTVPFTAPEIPTSRFLVTSSIFSLGVSVMSVLDGNFLSDLRKPSAQPISEFMNLRLEELKKNLNGASEKDFESVTEFIKAATLIQVSQRREALMQLNLPEGIKKQLSKERREAWIQGEKMNRPNPKPVFEDTPLQPLKPMGLFFERLKRMVRGGQNQCIEFFR